MTDLFFFNSLDSLTGLLKMLVLLKEAGLTFVRYRKLSQVRSKTSVSENKLNIR